MSGLIYAIGLVLIIEGLVYVLAPHLVEKLLQALRDTTIDQRRFMGLEMAVLGAFLVWMVKS
jgi:uncharacterized protein YjeT (DUF2065 family)